MFMNKIIVISSPYRYAWGFWFHHIRAAAKFVCLPTYRTLLQSIPLVMHLCMGQNIIQMSLVMVGAKTFLAVFEGAQ